MGRRDLGGQFARITKRLVELEEPVLARHEVSMWEYVVLSRLREGRAATQLQLAEEVGYDKTRLIPLLEGLEQRTLITRERSPDDGRMRTVELTREGRALVQAVRHDIHRLENRLLPARERKALQELLDRL